MRDPRDLVVSGYFYHKKGSEKWCLVRAPRHEDWRVVNGRVPSGVADETYSDYLNRVSTEDGLLAEIEFRQHHFQSMLDWEDHKDILLFKYEDILGRELEVVERITQFYLLPRATKNRVLKQAETNTLKNKISRDRHIRNPSPKQWKSHFTDRVAGVFEEQWGAILDRYGYR